MLLRLKTSTSVSLPGEHVFPVSSNQCFPEGVRPCRKQAGNVMCVRCPLNRHWIEKSL